MTVAKARTTVSARGSESRRAVLVIDNEPLIQRLLGRVLEHDFAVTVAENVDDALEAMESQPFFAILADYELGHPSIKGDWLLAQAHRIAPAARRLLMSGYPVGLRAARERGDVHAVLRKPFQRADLLRALDADSIGDQPPKTTAGTALADPTAR